LAGSRTGDSEQDTMSAEQITIEVISGVIHIQQIDPMGNHDNTIIVSADQVSQVIKWLRNCRDQIQRIQK
jgi:hypothetical protein